MVAVLLVIKRGFHWLVDTRLMHQNLFLVLAVTGVIATDRVKRNASAEAGCKLYLTKPLGIGVLTTAEKKGKLKPEHQGLATAAMCQMNLIGSQFAEVAGVTAMTDVTGLVIRALS